MNTMTAIQAAQHPADSGVRQGICMYLAAPSSRPFGVTPVCDILEGSDWRPPGG